jgi:hypothetical protein
LVAISCLLFLFFLSFEYEDLSLPYISYEEQDAKAFMLGDQTLFGTTILSVPDLPTQIFHFDIPHVLFGASWLYQFASM